MHRVLGAGRPQLLSTILHRVIIICIRMTTSADSAWYLRFTDNYVRVCMPIRVWWLILLLVQSRAPLLLQLGLWTPRIHGLLIGNSVRAGHYYKLYVFIGNYNGREHKYAFRFWIWTLRFYIRLANILIATYVATVVWIVRLDTIYIEI